MYAEVKLTFGWGPFWMWRVTVYELNGPTYHPIDIELCAIWRTYEGAYVKALKTARRMLRENMEEPVVRTFKIGPESL